MAGEFGTATGVVLWFDRTNGVGKILGLLNGTPQAYFDSDGTIKAAGGQIVLDETGIRLLFSGGSGYGVDAYGSGQFGGPVENILQFEFTGGSTWFALSHADEDYLDVGADTNSGDDGFPTKWRFHKSGAYVLPIMTAAPAAPDEGMIVYADGTSWDPGNGAGFYGYIGGIWEYFPYPGLSTGEVTTDKIADGAVTNVKLAADAVTADKIAAGAVGSSEIATDAVTSAEIAAGAVGTSEIADGAVTNAKLAADAVTADKIAAGAVGSSEIATDAVTSAEIAAGAVGTSEIADGAVTNAKLAAGAAGAVLVDFTQTTDTSTTSTAFVDLSSHTFTARGSPIMIVVSLPFYNASYHTYFDIVMDSTGLGSTNGVWQTSITAQHQMFTYTLITTPSAGSHTLHVQWKTSGGTLYMYAGTRGVPMRVQVMEIS